MTRILALSLLLLFSVAGLSQEDDGAESTESTEVEKPKPAKGLTLCKNRGLVRSIRVEQDPASKEYITVYTKFGKDRIVGRAKWKPSAVGFQTNIKNNLIKAGWDCRDVEKFKVLAPEAQ